VYAVKPKADRDLDEYADYLTDQANLEVALRFFTEAYETFSFGLVSLHFRGRREYP
jgi:uncharacterized protein YozE (UPF0346 family)